VIALKSRLLHNTSSLKGLLPLFIYRLNNDLSAIIMKSLFNQPTNRIFLIKNLFQNERSCLISKRRVRFCWHFRTKHIFDLKFGTVFYDLQFDFSQPQICVILNFHSPEPCASYLLQRTSVCF